MSEVTLSSRGSSSMDAGLTHKKKYEYSISHWLLDFSWNSAINMALG